MYESLYLTIQRGPLRSICFTPRYEVKAECLEFMRRASVAMSSASSDDTLQACKKTHWPQADRIFRTSPPAVTGAARCAWLSGAASARSPSQPASKGPKPLLLSAAAAAPPAMLCALQ